MKGILVGVGLFFIAATVAAAPDKIQKARDFFARYIAYENAFNAEVVDLYAPQARIENRRYYPNGHVRNMTVEVSQYKIMVRLAMPLAKMKGDTNEYRDCRYQGEGENVRVSCQRYSNLKKYISPFSLLIGFEENDHGLILEEISVSQP